MLQKGLAGGRKAGLRHRSLVYIRVVHFIWTIPKYASPKANKSAGNHSIFLLDDHKSGPCDIMHGPFLQRRMYYS